MKINQARFYTRSVLLFIATIWSTSVVSLTIDMAIGTPNSNHYASRHPGSFSPIGDSLTINFTMPSPGDLAISFVTYDIDYAREAFVEFDGGARQFLSAGSNNGHSSKQTIAILGVNPGSHSFTFQTQKPDRRWGISDLTISTTNTEPDDSLPVNALLSELGCAPGQIIEATSTDEWRCVSQCPATVQAIWAVLSNDDFLNPVRSMEGYVTVIDPPELSPEGTPPLSAGECSVDVDKQVFVVYDPGLLPVSTNEFRVSLTDSSVAVRYTDDLGVIVGPRIFPVADSEAARACAVLFGCPATF